MAKRCELTGVGVQSGNNVSHSNRKTRRRFLPNLQDVSVVSKVLGKLHLRITTSTLRSIDHNGGVDNFLITATNSKLTEKAKKLKRKIKKATAGEKKVEDKKPVKRKAPARKAILAKKASAKKAASA